jgi:uncharacterized membrane protein YphA (DoxX/SURF4 family)
MNLEAYRKYETLILRIFLGMTLLVLGFQKLTIENLAGMFERLYGGLLIINAESFVFIFGSFQIILGITMIIGLFTRVAAAMLALIALAAIILTGAIIHGTIIIVPYAFATAGGAVVLFIEGSGAWSLDEKILSVSLTE